MIFDPPLVPARLISRYKRFLFDAELDGGEKITGSCPNTGSMRGLTTPGSNIWVSLHDSPTRKYRHMLEIVEADGTLAGINTGLPNRLALEAIMHGLIPSLGGYRSIRKEQKYGRNSRIDILLSDRDPGNPHVVPFRPDTYVEVKNVHFMRKPGLAEFPDTVTARGAKHLEELGDMAVAGHRAVMLYLVQRGDCDRFSLCSELDPAYAAAFRRAKARGVEAMAVNCRVTPYEITPDRLIAMDETASAAYEIAK